MQKRKRKPKRSHKKTPFTTLLLLLLLIGTVSVFFVSTQVKADTTPQAPTYKYYTSIRLEAGDTLWDIAAQYYSPEYKDIPAYIKEIKKINHLTSSHITEGKYLCIPYYTTEYKG